MSLFPLPAIIFLCAVIVLLVTLLIVYLVLKKTECCSMEGTGEEGEDEALLSTDGISREDESKDGTINIGNGGTSTHNSNGFLGGDETDSKFKSNNQSIHINIDERRNIEIQETKNGVSPPAPPIKNGISPSVPPIKNDVPGDINIAEDDKNQPVEFIESEEQEPVIIAGKILVQFTYMPNANKVNLTLIRIGEMPTEEQGGSAIVQAHLCILPMRNQRFRTGNIAVRSGVFNETFQFIHITKDVIETCAIRLRIYGTRGWFNKRLIGECKMPLSQIDLTSPLADEQIWKTLSPKGLVAYLANIDEEDEPDDFEEW